MKVVDLLVVLWCCGVWEGGRVGQLSREDEGGSSRAVTDGVEPESEKKVDHQ